MVFLVATAAAVNASRRKRNVAPTKRILYLKRLCVQCMRQRARVKGMKSPFRWWVPIFFLLSTRYHKVHDSSKGVNDLATASTSYPYRHYIYDTYMIWGDGIEPRIYYFPLYWRPRRNYIHTSKQWITEQIAQKNAMMRQWEGGRGDSSKKKCMLRNPIICKLFAFNRFLIHLIFSLWTLFLITRHCLPSVLCSRQLRKKNNASSASFTMIHVDRNLSALFWFFISFNSGCQRTGNNPHRHRFICASIEMLTLTRTMEMRIWEAGKDKGG